MLVLIAAFLVTALGTALPMVVRLPREVSLLLDVVPFVGALGATFYTAARSGIVAGKRSAATIAFVCHAAGGIVGALGVAHSTAVIVVAIERDPFVYDFRFYTLMLLGALLIAGGFVAAVAAARLARGEEGARRSALAAWAAILAINVPLIPLQGFAILFSVFAVVALILLRLRVK